MNKKKLIRITTIPASLKILLKGQLNFMTDSYEVLGVASSGKELNEVLENEKIASVKAIDMSRKITPLQDIKSVWQLYKFLKKEQPHIVHTHTPKAGIVGMLAAYFAGVPHRLHTVAGLPLLVATGNKRKLLSFVEKFTYRFATKVYPNSFGLKDIILQEKFTSEKKLKVLANGSSNGIDTAHFSPEHFSVDDNLALKNTLGIQEKDLVFIFVGRLVTDKGINELISAFGEISKEYSHAKLLLVGDYEKELDPILPESELIIRTNPSIIPVGFKNDVRPYFAIANALVFPSYREGFPNVVMQAGAMGLPSIVSNINGCNEIIIDEKNGCIVPTHCSKSLYNKMKLMLEDSQFTNKLQSEARQTICENYEQNRVWKAILNEYKSLN